MAQIVAQTAEEHRGTTLDRSRRGSDPADRRRTRSGQGARRARIVAEARRRVAEERAWDREAREAARHDREAARQARGQGIVELAQDLLGQALHRRAQAQAAESWEACAKFADGCAHQTRRRRITTRGNAPPERRGTAKQAAHARTAGPRLGASPARPKNARSACGTTSKRAGVVPGCSPSSSIGSGSGASTLTRAAQQLGLRVGKMRAAEDLRHRHHEIPFRDVADQQDVEDAVVRLGIGAIFIPPPM